MTQLAVDAPASSGKTTSGALTPGRAPRPPNLGLGLSSAGNALITPHKDIFTSSPYPHLAYYITTLLASVTQPSPPRQHPLSVSSSGESDEDTPPGGRSRDEAENGTGGVKDTDAKSDSGASNVTTASSTSGDRKVSGADKEKEVDKTALVNTIVELLDNEEEEKVKDVLKPYLGDLANDEILMEQVCLDCMHKRKDDQEQLPFTPANLTPSRPRLTPHVTAPLRPYSPSRVPSFRAVTPIGRPQSPLLSGTVTPTGLPGHPQPTPIRHESASKLNLGQAGLSPNPNIASLSAKATTFNPNPRVASPSAVPATSAYAHTWIPADAWKDAPEPLSRTASPFGGATMARTSSNLAIAAPLFSGQSSPFHSPIGTPLKGTVKMPDVFSSPSAQQPLARTASVKALIPDDDDDDEFSPFGTGLPKLHHHGDAPALQLNSGAQPFEPFSGAKSSSSHSQGSADYEDALSDGGAGMTPLDVLHQVFTSLPRHELEAALHAAGYDFEGAMALLMSQHAGAGPRSGTSTPGRTASPRPLMNIGGRGLVQANHHAPSAGYFNQGGRNFGPGAGPAYQQQAYAGAGHGHGARTPGGLKMCRYYLNGECRRSDCRFSHDLDRALCRFWLRGNCAKGPNCEFLHQLPPNLTQQASSFDPTALSSAMSRLELSQDGSYRRSPAGTPTEEFPDLMGTRYRAGNRFDPSRNRFANALKRPQGQFHPTMPAERGQIHVTGARMNTGGGGSGTSFAPPDQRQNLLPTTAASQTIPTPKPSSRLRLRPPTLLPTINTGAVANEQYLTSRQSAIRLGHARNACLARAADAFRRGDGAAAKRFSREGKSLNERMLHESAEAAAVLVKERMASAQQAIRERDPAWSDEPADRAMRGKEAGGGFGVLMGVAGMQKLKQQGQGTYGDASIEERVECLCDLHTLHGVEAVEVLGVFLAELEKERFRGLTYLLVGEEKHVGLQDPLRGTSKIRLAHSVKVYLTEEGYPWMEGQGWICLDSCRS